MTHLWNNSQVSQNQSHDSELTLWQIIIFIKKEMLNIEIPSDA